MQLIQILEKIGLTEKKATVYLTMLELGSSTVIEITKKAEIKRTTCYDILLNLQARGLIYKTIKKKKTLYTAENPEKILKDLKEKEKLFSEALPELLSIHNAKSNKPKIRFYEGKEGLREVYDDTLKYKGEILAFASEDVARILGEDWVDDYLKKRTKKSIRVRAIMPESAYISEKIASEDQKQLRASKLVNPQKYPFSIEINIYGHQKIALMSVKEEAALIIEGYEIHKTMKLIFELLWNSLPEINLK